jgi:hypothetical protein
LQIWSRGPVRKVIRIGSSRRSRQSNRSTVNADELLTLLSQRELLALNSARRRPGSRPDPRSDENWRDFEDTRPARIDRHRGGARWPTGTDPCKPVFRSGIRSMPDILPPTADSNRSLRKRNRSLNGSRSKFSDIENHWAETGCRLSPPSARILQNSTPETGFVAANLRKCRHFREYPKSQARCVEIRRRVRFRRRALAPTPSARPPANRSRASRPRLGALQSPPGSTGRETLPISGASPCRCHADYFILHGSPLA